VLGFGLPFKKVSSAMATLGSAAEWLGGRSLSFLQGDHVPLRLFLQVISCPLAQNKQKPASKDLRRPNKEHKPTLQMIMGYT
jgi:hypothetical protein